MARKTDNKPNGRSNRFWGTFSPEVQKVMERLRAACSPVDDTTVISQALIRLDEEVAKQGALMIRPPRAA